MIDRSSAPESEQIAAGTLEAVIASAPRSCQCASPPTPSRGQLHRTRWFRRETLSGGLGHAPSHAGCGSGCWNPAAAQYRLRPGNDCRRCSRHIRSRPAGRDRRSGEPGAHREGPDRRQRRLRSVPHHRSAARQLRSHVLAAGLRDGTPNRGGRVRFGRHPRQRRAQRWRSDGNGRRVGRDAGGRHAVRAPRVRARRRNTEHVAGDARIRVGPRGGAVAEHRRGGGGGRHDGADHTDP